MTVAKVDLPPLTPEQAWLGRMAVSDGETAPYAALDPETLTSLAWQHKLRPALAAAFRRGGWTGVAADLRRQIEATERERSVRALRQLSLLADIARIAADEGLRVLTLKGVPLSMLLHGDPFIREAHDVDLLVSPDDAGRLGQALTALDLHAAPGHGASGRFAYDRVFHSADGQVVLELHHRLSADTRLMPTDFEGLWVRRDTVSLGGAGHAVMGARDLLPYLILHAAKHGWERWKWVSDIARLMRRLDVETLDAIRADQRAKGLLAVFDSAVLIAAHVTGDIASPDLWVQAAANRPAVALARHGLRISAVAQTAESLFSRRAQLERLAYRARLKPDLGHIWFELSRALHRETRRRRAHPA